MDEKPWVILTLRRTGGTSLTSFLAKSSGFMTAEHEPFNLDRTHGHITRAFQKTGDIAAMEAAIDDALVNTPNIKHCVEIIPPELTRALIDACKKRGYGVIVLTRRDEARRLASLFLAISTQAWGPDAAAIIYPKIISREITLPPFDLKQIRQRTHMDYYSMGRTLSILRNRKIDFGWYLFEELYFGETPIEIHAREIAKTLGVTIAKDDDLLKEFSHTEGQKSGDIAKYVPNFDEAVALLAELCSS